MKKIIRFIKKIFQGENPLIVRYPEEKWEAQFERGYWDFLLETHHNTSVIVMMVHQYARQSGRKIRVLDVGCGNGALARSLDATLVSYHGTDISAAALAQARTVAPDGIFLQASMETPPIFTEPFDIIIFSEVLLYGRYQEILPLHRSALCNDGFMIVSLYDTWRTKFIWRAIKRQLHTVESIYVKNNERGVAWTIIAGTLK